MEYYYFYYERLTVKIQATQSLDTDESLVPAAPPDGRKLDKPSLKKDNGTKTCY
jgi:hypothetical protein